MKIKNEEILLFNDALYEAQCPICGEKIEWEANFDADGTNYSAECCGESFYMVPYRVKIYVSDGKI